MTIPKLDGAEALALTFSLLLSQIVFLLISLVVLMIMDAFGTGHGLASFTTGSWTNPIATSLQAQPPAITCGLACVTSLVLFAYAAWSEKRGLRNEKTRTDIIASRQGIAGEIPRLPLLLIIVLMGIVGFSEELLFRFLVLGTLYAVLAPLCGSILAACISIAISSIVFCLAHILNNGSGAIATWLILGVVLGTAFVLTESLAAIAAAHAIYNIAVLVTTRIKMHHDPNYFDGSIPTRILIDSDES